MLDEAGSVFYTKQIACWLNGKVNEGMREVSLSPLTDGASHNTLEPRHTEEPRQDLYVCVCMPTSLAACIKLPFALDVNTHLTAFAVEPAVKRKTLRE